MSMYTLREILDDFQKLGICDESIYSSVKPDEWKVEQILKEYIKTHDDILAEHKPVFYKIYNRHPRWHEKPKDDITIYKAGPTIKSYGSIQTHSDGTKEVTSISYQKCIYGEDNLLNTIEALFNATFATRNEMKSICYKIDRCCSTCKSRNHIRNLKLVLGTKTQKQISHDFLHSIDCQVLNYEMINNRPQLTNLETIKLWLDYFKRNATPELACEPCNTARYEKLLDIRNSKFSYKKSIT